jgi:hypothetical protein
MLPSQSLLANDKLPMTTRITLTSRECLERVLGHIDSFFAEWVSPPASAEIPVYLRR